MDDETTPTQSIRRLQEPDTTIDEFFLDEQSIEQEKRSVRRKLGMTPSHKAPPVHSFYERLAIRLRRAGISEKPSVIIKRLLLITIGFVAAGSLALGIVTLLGGFPFLAIIIYLVGWSATGFLLFYTLVNLSFRVYLSYRVFKRRVAVEQALPDFLRLVATNYRSGMPLDEALLKSNRPRFGIFSDEIALVAKTAKVRGDLAKALEIFSKKFDSKILQRAMNNIVMSVRSGSNISSLLEDIASNITKMRNMRASMAANVKNYVIFIVVAGVIIAPLMFSMSAVMNNTITGVKNDLTIEPGGQASTSLASSFSAGGGVKAGDFNAFAILMLITNSVVSAFVISMIRHGNFEQGITRIPLFAAISIVLFLLGKHMLVTLVSVL